MHDRENCTICGKPVLGGHDQVAYLESPVMSFHLVQHLECRLKQEREACAAIADSHHRLAGGYADTNEAAKMAKSIANSIRNRI